MSQFEMWRSMTTLKALFIFAGFMIFSFGSTVVFTVVGLLMLVLAGYMLFRTGTGCGHAACGMSKTLERSVETGHEPDKKLVSQSFSVGNGVRAVFAGAMIPYVLNCVYMICMVTGIGEVPTLITRMLSWIANMPVWPIVAMFHEVYNVLTWDIILLEFLGPFVLPMCFFIGYLQGPKLWTKTETAMADGRRRAKARSRILSSKAKKQAPKSKQPEI